MIRFRPLSLVWLALLLLSACAPATQPETCDPASTLGADRIASTYRDTPGTTAIAGNVHLAETTEPLTDAYVNVYPDTISNLLGPSQYISLPTAADGSYSIELPPGTYYVVARKRVSGDPTGPLSPGDFYSEHQRVVANVVPDRTVLVDLEVVAMQAPMFFKKMVIEKETATGFRGHLVDANGQPIMGGFAMAYSDPDMKRLPDFASTLSDREGSFTLYLPAGGTYYLAARVHAWDMPRPGEPYGIYGGDTPTAMEIATGSFREKIEIVMTPFSGNYQPGKSRRPF
ncbi:MAG: hypothetical protein C0624_14160 [Desulfuromonas sp.]|nr:MAG: hypothetical protein C0624_14160 [Desulfuromonas sp.]